MLLVEMQRCRRCRKRSLEDMALREWAADRSVVASSAEPEFVLVFVPQSIAMLPDPGVVLLDIASRLIPFDTPPVDTC